MLPQKFSAATTAILVEPPVCVDDAGDAVEQPATAAMTAAATPTPTTDRAPARRKGWTVITDGLLVPAYAPDVSTSVGVRLLRKVTVRQMELIVSISWRDGCNDHRLHLVVNDQQ
jgi:hypothetical protein